MIWYEFVRYLEFYSTNEHSDSLILGHVPLIKLKYIPTSCYLDRDTIAQLLPTRRIQHHVISTWLNKKCEYESDLRSNEYYLSSSKNDQKNQALFSLLLK